MQNQPISRRLDAKVALTIAGSDCGGGAGIQADLKTFHSHGVFGAAVVTALTAQNTLGVHGIREVEPAFVRAQLDAVLGDIGAAACKTGMLSSAAIVTAVAAGLKAHGVSSYVCDPVMVAKGGARLLRPEAEAALVERLLPLAALVTPNAEEAAVLSGEAIADRAGMERAARAIARLGPAAVLIKGGHLEIEQGVALDLLFDGESCHELRSPRLTGAPTHGAGCTLSAAITAGLARGLGLLEAVSRARAYLHAAFRAGGVPGRGQGHGCPDHRVSA